MNTTSFDNTTLAETNISNKNTVFIDTIPPVYSKLGVIIGCLVLLVGVFGNVLVLLAIALNKSLHKIHTIFIASMAILDLLFNLGGITIQVYIFHLKSWPFGPGMCWYMTTVLQYIAFATGYHVPVIAIQRYFVVVHPELKPYFNVQSKKFVIGCLFGIHFLVSCIVIFPNVPIMIHPTQSIEIVFLTKFMSCIVLNASNGVLIFTPCSVFTCITIIGYCYGRIAYLVRKAQKNLQNAAMSRSNKKELQLLHSLILIFLFFVISYSLLPIIAISDTRGQLTHGYYFPAIVMLWVSGCNNWIVYGLMNKDFRRAYKGLLRVDNPASVGTVTIGTQNEGQT